MKNGLLILACFAVGILVGKLGWIPRTLGDGALDLALSILLFVAGMGMGFDTRNFPIVRDLGWRVTLLPLSVIIGSTLGSLAIWGLLPLLGHTMPLRDVLGVAAGFGYYSLSSVMIAGMDQSSLGSVALIANISHELITMLLAPLLVRLAGGFAPVVTAGAAAMDTCLPIIAHYGGERYAIMGVFSGMVLTMLVPVLITGIFTWF